MSQINPPRASKINATSGIGVAVNALVGIAVAYDYVRPEAAVHVAVLANAALYALIGVFRTWFTA